MNFTKQSLTLSITLCLAATARAEVTTTSPVLVTATRTEQAAQTSLASVTIIDAETIRNSQTQDVAELLRLQAGIDIARNGGPGQSTSFFIRGTESNHTVVLIDGVKINPGTIGQSAIQNIDPALIERIEIVRGPRSTLYGSDAIGGVVNIITRREARSYVSATAGRYSTRKLNAGFGNQSGDWSYGIDVSGQRTDGFPTKLTSSTDHGYDNNSFNGTVGYHHELADIELRHWQASGNTEYDSSGAKVDQDYTNRTTAVSIASQAADNWLSKLTLSRMEDEIQQQQGNDFIRTRRNSLDWQNDIELDRHLITAGITLWREKADAISYGSPYQADTDTNEVFIQDDMDFGKHKFLVGARHTNHDTAGTKNTWNLGYGYAVSDATYIYANAGTAFHAPDATDRFGFGGNANLGPETSRSYEIGMRHSYSPELKTTVAIFQNKIKNLIVYPAPTYTATNIDEAKIRGIEAGMDYRRGNWDLGLQASLQNPRDESNDEQLARRAKRSLTGTVNYHWNQARIGAELLAASSRKDSHYSSVINGGYGLINLTADYPLGNDLTLAGRIENLTDKQYALADGYRTADRSLYLTLSYAPGGGKR